MISIFSPNPSPTKKPPANVSVSLYKERYF
jgi:hypothetical protein